jgi:hypothetical protein
VKFGCFHREHSPRAYEIIDKYLAVNAPKDAPFVFEEHERGPEILLWLAAIAGAFSFSASGRSPPCARRWATTLTSSSIAIASWT